MPVLQTWIGTLIFLQACKLQMNPPNLTFTRVIKFSVDVMIFFTPRVTGLEVSHRKGHLFLTTDLLLICEKMTPEEQASFGPGGPDMWLCYPPLAGKHLQTGECLGGQGSFYFGLDVYKCRLELITFFRQYVPAYHHEERGIDGSYGVQAYTRASSEGYPGVRGA